MLKKKWFMHLDPIVEELILKLLLVGMLFMLFFLMYRFFPKFYKGLGNFQRAIFNKKLNSQTTKILISIEDTFIVFFKFFCWIGFLAFAYAILISDLSEFVHK